MRALPDARRYFPQPRAAVSAKSRAAPFSVQLLALTASTALGEVERPQAAKRPRTRGWGQQSTGKEEDVEVGLQYFGKRYYAPLLGRWVSADPLTVHALGADLNVYAYVSGKALKAVDPRGLCNPAETSCEATASTPEGGVQYGGGHDTTIVRHTQGAGPARTQPRAAASGKTHDLIPGGAAPSELAQLGAEPSEYNASVTDAEARKSNLDPAITVAGAVGEVLGGDGLDFAEMVDPRSSTRDRVIAGASLAVGIGPLPNLARIRKFFKSSESEYLIRYGSEVEAKAAKGTQQLAPKPGHTTDKRVADWNADIKPQKLGAAKQYSHRMDIEVEQGTRDWLKQWEIEGEPGRYAVPFERIGELNARIRTIMVEKVRKVR